MTEKKQKVNLETHRELIHARLEISRLQSANRALTQRFAATNEELQSHLPCPLAELPHEILLIVLRYTLPPAWLLSGDDDSLPPFPQSIWSAALRTKLAIVAVCKTWHQLGIGLLYASVTLRRIGQIPAFLCTLEEGEGLRVLVRRLEIGCFVPHGYSALHDRDIVKILRLCSRLSHFAFKPPSNIPLTPCILPDMGSSITSLELSSNVNYSLVLPSLARLAPTLHSLSLTLPYYLDDNDDDDDDDGYDTHPLLDFTNLEDLRLRFTPESTVPDASQWRMPRLQRLWIHSSSYIINDEPMEMFLDVFGGSVTFLRLSDYRTAPSIQGLLDRCPALTHLALVTSMYKSTPELKHPKVNHVDIFASFDGSMLSQLPAPLPIMFGQLKGGFPALRSFRTLDCTASFLSDIPVTDATMHWALDLADENNASDNSEHSDRGESAWIAAVLSPDIDSDDSDDGDYLFNEKEDDGGSVDSSDCGDDSDATGCLTDNDSANNRNYLTVREEFYLGDHREIGHEEALDIFRRS
ncbi:hypothetical protein C8R43DRAFT_968436 [Mycena crocata]|nr:hypothetical protein C8R43DRAFT_968436 [Mycena crocata]